MRKTYGVVGVKLQTREGFAGSKEKFLLFQNRFCSDFSDLESAV